MNCKFIYVCFALVLLFCVNNVLAIDVAYIVKEDGNPNFDLIYIMEDEGISYEVIDESDIKGVDFDDYEMILVWDEPLENYEDIPVKSKKSLIGNTRYLDEWGISKRVDSRVGTGYEYGRIITSNSITQGLTSPMKLYNKRNLEFCYLPRNLNDRATGLKNIVSKDSSHMNIVIGTIDAFEELYGGGLAGGKIAFFGLVHTDSWTDNSRLLFIRTLDWVLNGEDLDGDGYDKDIDCDDRNGNIWQNADAYVDSDEDDYGAGNLIEICSGDELPTGYSDNDEDCDDDDNLINPGKTEIPFDGVDNDCSGFDLTDVSNLTCSEVNGEVCNNNEVCNGNILDVIDDDNCCNIECSDKPIEFSDISGRKNLDQSLELELKEPDENEEFFIREIINVDLDIKNNLGDDLDFNVNAYLYDATEEEIVSEEEDSIDVIDGKRRFLRFEFTVPEDIDEDNLYYIFVQAEDEDEEYYNEAYIKIDIDREDRKIVIEDFEIYERPISCRDYLTAEIRIRNLGKQDEDIFVELDIPDLDILQESETYDLEKYDERDSVEVVFNFVVPNDIEDGNYDATATVFYNGGSEFEDMEIVISGCSEDENENGIITQTEITPIETTSVSTIDSEPVYKETDGGINKVLLFIVAGFGFLLGFVLLIVVVVFLFFNRNDSKGKDKGKKKNVKKGKRRK